MLVVVLLLCPSFVRTLYTHPGDVKLHCVLCVCMQMYVCVSHCAFTQMHGHSASKMRNFINVVCLCVYNTCTLYNLYYTCNAYISNNSGMAITSLILPFNLISVHRIKMVRMTTQRIHTIKCCRVRTDSEMIVCRTAFSISRTHTHTHTPFAPLFSSCMD